MFPSETNSELNNDLPSETEIANAFTGVVVGAAPEMENRPEESKKHFGKKGKIALLIVVWVVLLGLGAGAAFLFKPEPEVVHTDAIIEAYKFSGETKEEVTDTVEDLDYYGYYSPNPVSFYKVFKERYGSVYNISGLKNKTVEEKINNIIKEKAERLYNVSSNGSVIMTVTANLYNVFSLKMEVWDNASNKTLYEYLTVDLNTGDELTFDNLFSPGISLSSILAKSFYDDLSTSIKFDRLNASRALSNEASNPDPSTCMVMYCPEPGQTYDDIRELIAEYDSKLANMEETTIITLQNYLSGKKRFYLNSFGPAFVLDDGTVISMELKDNIKYAVYLKNYRSVESLFESENIEPVVFFTETPGIYNDYYNEEGDKYLFDYAESLNLSDDIPLLVRRAYRDYIRKSLLSDSIENGRVRHFMISDAGVSSAKLAEDDKEIYLGRGSCYIDEADKMYYDKVYKKAIIDGKSQLVSLGNNQLARSGHFDPELVTIIENESSVFDVAITSSGKIIDKVDGILIDPSDDVFKTGWEEYLKQLTYSRLCSNSWSQKCYTEEEKQSQKMVFNVCNGFEICVSLYDKSGNKVVNYIEAIYFSQIPIRYINPELIVKK